MQDCGARVLVGSSPTFINVSWTLTPLAHASKCKSCQENWDSWRFGSRMIYILLAHSVLKTLMKLNNKCSVFCQSEGEVILCAGMCCYNVCGVQMMYHRPQS